MEPLTTAALISAGGSALGGALTGFMGQSANQANIASQERSNALQVELSNTAYQRSVKDMRAAGLNPGLMYGAGMASGTPNINAPRQEMLDLGASVGTTAQSLANNLPGLLSVNSELKSMELSQIEAVARTAKLRDELKTAASQRALNQAQEALAKFQAQSKSVSEVGGRLLEKTIKAVNPGYWESTAQRMMDSLYNTFTGPDVAPLFEAPQK